MRAAIRPFTFTCLALGLLAGAAQAQSPSQFTSNASAFAARAAYPTIVVQESATNKGQWQQVQARAINSKWAVKPIDPKSTAMVATVGIDLFSGAGELKPTKDEAGDTAEIFLNKVEHVDLEFLPTATGWAFSKGRSTAGGKVTEIVPPPPGVFSPAGWLIQGFTPKN